jgi:hypothetical protein
VQKKSVVFAGVMGLATGVLTGNSGLSPIVPLKLNLGNGDIIHIDNFDPSDAANEAMLLAA